MRILFITRKYPPSVGGMQQYSADLVRALGSNAQVIALGRGQVHLLWWLPYAVLRGWWLSKQVDVIHIGDGVLAGVGWLLHWLTGKPISITVHGLDLTYQSFGYQGYIWKMLAKYQAVICVSQATAVLVKDHAIDAEQISVITNGIWFDDWSNQPRTRDILTQLIPGQDWGKGTVLLTVGRLVERKGVAWFVKYVMPGLPNTMRYIVTSSGPMQVKIEQEIIAQQLQDRVWLVGRQSREVIQQLYRAADLLVLPNIIVPNDPEGFGIVAVEAAASGTAVMAADCDGLPDAVVDGGTGSLVQSGSVSGWIKRLTECVPLAPNAVTSVAKARYDWRQLAEQYQAVFNRLSTKHHGQR